MSPTSALLPLRSLPSVEAVQAAWTNIDKIWADADADDRPATVAEAEAALQELATAIGLQADPDGKDGDPLISLALAVAGYLRAALEAAYTPGDPADEYELLLKAAADEAVRNPPAALALAAVADRWLSPDLIDARRRRPVPAPTIDPIA